jgi:hypothetical protein
MDNAIYNVEGVRRYPSTAGLRGLLEPIHTRLECIWIWLFFFSKSQILKLPKNILYAYTA